MIFPILLPAYDNSNYSTQILTYFNCEDYFRPRMSVAHHSPTPTTELVCLKNPPIPCKYNQLHLTFGLLDPGVSPRVRKSYKAMTSLAPYIPLEEEDADDRIDDTYVVELKKELVPTKESFDQHIKWLETTSKDDPHPRILKTTFSDRYYLAELSSEALLKVRQRRDVLSVGEHANLNPYFYAEKVKNIGAAESSKENVMYDRKM